MVVWFGGVYGRGIEEEYLVLIHKLRRDLLGSYNKRELYSPYRPIYLPQHSYH